MLVVILIMSTVLCLGVPAGAMIGIDLKSWVVGDRFQGITGIPPGPHYLYYAATDDAGMGISSGRFLYFEADDEVWVGEWNSSSEEILPLSDDSQAARYRHGVLQHDFDFNLGRYPEEMAAEWRSLSLYITKECIRRLAPIGSVICPSQAPGRSDSVSETTARIYYTDLKIGMPREDPVEVTANYLDKSRLLERLAESRFSGDYEAILGEFQFAFVTFLLGQSFEGFEQWKELILILCSCDAALWDQRIFFDKFIDAFPAQIRLVPKDFFESELTSNNFMYRALTDLFELGQETPFEDKLVRFKNQAENKFQWRFGSQLNVSGRFDSGDEDAPVIVEL